MESRNRLKESLSRIFRSSCNSTTSTSIFSSPTAATTSRTLSSAAADVAHEPLFLPRRHHATHHRSHHYPTSPFLLDNSLDLHRSLSSLLSADCGGCRPLPERRRSRKKERRVRETGGFYETGEGEGRMCPPASPSSPFNMIEQSEKKKKQQLTIMSNRKLIKKKKKFLSNGDGFSSSSSVESDHDEFGLFSSDDEGGGKEEETENFFSSRSFSSDSSEFYRRPKPRKSKKKNKKRKEKRRERHSSRELEFRPLVSASNLVEEEKGFAVMKRSTDPYGDFRSSMVEMIVERQIFGAQELERLLIAYLSLNSPHHHPIILRAFAEISEVLFGH